LYIGRKHAYCKVKRESLVVAGTEIGIEVNVEKTMEIKVQDEVIF
jgi:hypothetical protein